MSKELAQKQELPVVAQEITPMTMLNMAVQQGADIDKLEKLMELQERWEANEARKAYAQAMAAVEKEIPIVIRGSENRQTNSRYAKEDAISKVIKPIYTEYGFSLSFDTDDSKLDNHIRVICHILHASGHKEDRHIDYPYDSAGIKGMVNKTPIHAYKSTVSYAKNTLTCMAFNVATGDDDDGNRATIPAISEEQANEIHAKITDNGLDMNAFIGWLKKTLKCNSIEEINQNGYGTVINTLNTSIANKAKKK